jgi:hypothetical protein
MTKSQKERYLFLKAHKICVWCGQESAAPNSVLCINCRDKKRFYDKYIYDKTEKRRTYERNYRRKIHDERIKHGLCSSCGKEKPDNYAYQMCPACRAKFRKYSEKYRRKNGILSLQERKYIGICRYCDNPVAEGRSYCEKHLEQARKGAQIATEKRLASLAWKNKKEELFAWTFLRRCFDGFEAQDTITQPSHGIS